MRVKRNIVAMLTVFCVLFSAFAAGGHDQVPGPQQQQPLALVGGTIHTVNGPVIENGTIVFEEGIITALGVQVEIPRNAVTVNVTGKHVYPGLIEPVSQLGLAEIDAVRATVDYIETGDINPNVRAETAVNADSERIPVTRSNGVAVAGTVPWGGLIAGMAALIELDGWTWEEMTLSAPAGLVVAWPGMSVTSAYGMQKSGDNRRKETQKRLDLLDETMRDARAYLIARENADGRDMPTHETDVRWEAMIPVLRGDVPVWVFADNLQQIESAVEWADRHGLRMVLIGGADAPAAAGLLKRKNIPVIVTPILRLPERRHSRYDEPYIVPKRLYDAGVRFCIAGASGYGNERNLPYNAAMAAAFGLPKDEALKAVTIHAADILGVSDRIGSLEKGKDATLMVTDGDPLEITTNVERLFIRGRDVDLDNKQKMLYRKYTEKYRQHDNRR